MLKVIKAQFNQLPEAKLKFIIWTICMVLGYFTVFLFNIDAPEVSASCYAGTQLSVALTFAMFFIFTAVGDICAGDFSDKTIYTELLSGRTRTQAYFGRAITAIIFTMIGSLLIICSPVLISLVKYGWGTYITVGDFLLRLAVLTIPLLRLICTFICIAFIVKNRYVVIIVGYGILFMLSLVNSMAKDAPAELLGLTSFSKLSEFRSWVTFGVSSSVNYIVDASIPVNELISISVCSLAASAVFLFIGWSFFRRDDLN